MDKVKRTMPKHSVLLSSAKMCYECKNPVFISERVIFMKKLYHRSCFCCSKCKNPLNPHIVDLSSDGSLFCLEKTCHAELFKTTIESSLNKCVPDVNNVRNESDHKREDANLPSDSSADIHNNASKLNLPTSVSVDSSMRFRNIVQDEDSHSQGDMQNILQGKEQNILPTQTTPRNTKKFMDFAGSLYNNSDLQVSAEVDNPIPNSGDLTDNESKAFTEKDKESNDKESILIPQLEIAEERQEQDTDEQEQEAGESILTTETNDIQQQQIEVTQENEPENDNNLLVLKSAEEVTSIRDKAILTVADQFKLNVKEAGQVEEEENLELEPSLTSVIIVEEINSNQSLENHSVEEIESVESIESTESVIVHPRIIEQINDQSVNDTSTNDSSTNNPFEEEQTSYSENRVELDSLAGTPNMGTNPTPVPRQRPPKPPPPKFAPLSPSPTPRSRSSQQPSSSNRNSRSNMEDPKSTTELWKNKNYYPTELNPFASEEDLPEKAAKNPFEDDDDDDDNNDEPTAKPRSTTPSKEINNNGNMVKDSPALPNKNAANFNVPPPRPPPPQPSPRKVVIPPKEYNPFEDDDDIGNFDHEPSSSFYAKPTNDDETSSISSKTSDLSSISGVPTPTPRSLNASDTEGGTGSMKVRSRKSRRAPLPPTIMMTGSHEQPGMDLSSIKLPEEEALGSNRTSTPEKKIIPASSKLMKGLSTPSPRDGGTATTPRKKRRAPPPRRRVEPLPEASIKTEFADLEIKLKELERQGIALETKIRSLMEETDEGDQESESQRNDPAEVDLERSSAANGGVDEQVDEMMIQLWSIINEKNDILRRQTELEYLRRGHRLEEMQSELEFKLRILMDTAEDQKEPNQEDMEQALLQQLLKLVDERNEVVEWLDYHRQQEREEELMLAKSITQFSTSKTVEPIPDQIASSSKSKSKEKKLKEKSKDDKEKKDGKLRLGIFKKKHKKTKTIESSTEP
ncbi:F-actin-monooxygenase MICAL3 isoform X2 [Folsomia candida]|nr:F-actin-monooxygenase MICAL3 isoform X2 [Folsomia candida]